MNMTPRHHAPRVEHLASSLKHLIDEIIHVFPEGADGEDIEIQGRICLRLLEQAQIDAAQLFEAVWVPPKPPDTPAMPCASDHLDGAARLARR
jgi:hypothetical protein